MKSITIHNIDKDINEKLNELARKKEMSLNKTIKFLLRKALNLEKNFNEERKKNLSEFCGIWSQKDLESFRNATEDFEKVVEEEWK